MPRDTLCLRKEKPLDMTTLLIIVIIVLLLGGGGFYGRGPLVVSLHGPLAISSYLVQKFLSFSHPLIICRRSADIGATRFATILRSARHPLGGCSEV